MLSLTVATSTPHKKVVKKFKKFGKRLAKQREVDLRRMSDEMRRVAEDETRRTRELLREHREFFEKKGDDKKEESIDFFEK